MYKIINETKFISYFLNELSYCRDVIELLSVQIMKLSWVVGNRLKRFSHKHEAFKLITNQNKKMKLVSD